VALAVSEVAGDITPVPGGVGPMTVAMLMKNTLIAAKKSIVCNILEPGAVVHKEASQLRPRNRFYKEFRFSGISHFNSTYHHDNKEKLSWNAADSVHKKVGQQQGAVTFSEQDKRQKNTTEESLTFNITVFNATSFITFYSSTTCFGHTGQASCTIAIVAKAVSL
jgi:hypothetical protein